MNCGSFHLSPSHGTIIGTGGAPLGKFESLYSLNDLVQLFFRGSTLMNFSVSFGILLFLAYFLNYNISNSYFLNVVHFTKIFSFIPYCCL
jgi:hypothetical protein